MTSPIKFWFNPKPGVIEVSGADRVQFLHNILTNDIKVLTPGTETEACLLTAQAKIVAVMKVRCFDNYLWLICDYPMKNRLLESLQKLIIMEQVVLKDLTESQPIKLGQNEQADPQTLETMRITLGIPKYGIDYDETNIPLECLLDHTISFTKGCFPGQEIIARLDSRGGVSKKLCGLVLKGEVIPKKNDPILDRETEVGHITSATFSLILKKTIALGYLKKDSWKIGHPLTVKIELDQIPARVEELPFYRGSAY